MVGPQLMSRRDDTPEERIARLETALHYEQQMTMAALQSLKWRLHQLEQRPTMEPYRLDTAGVVKLLLALLLPLAVLVVTGSAEKAAAIARAMAAL